MAIDSKSSLALTLLPAIFLLSLALFHYTTHPYIDREQKTFIVSAPEKNIHHYNKGSHGEYKIRSWYHYCLGCRFHRTKELRRH